MSLSISKLHLQGKKILIVEDDQPTIRYYETLLSGSGAEISIFKNGQEFIDHIDQGGGKPDIVLLDFLIPLVNGVECLRYFRGRWQDVPVLMITAYLTEQSKMDACIAGCTEYVLKPIYPEKIFYLLGKYLKLEVSGLSVR